MYFYDTNALLKLGEKIYSTDEKFCISSVSLRELEDIKVSSRKDEEVKQRARNAIRLLDEHEDKYTVVTYEGRDDLSPDEKIIQCAKCIANVVFVSDDISCRHIARNVYGLKVEKAVDDKMDDYKGYVDIQLNDNDLASFYENPNVNTYNILTNQYVLIRDTSGNIIDQVKWDGESYVRVMAKPFKSNMFGTLKPLDPIQSIAMDSIASNDITVLYGRAGSGKTTLPLNYIMQQIEKNKIKKCYMVYSYEPLRNAKVLGYEKGDHITKLLYSASIGNLLASKFGDIAQVEYMIDRGTIDIIPTANIRGVEFESDSCVIVTECQNLDVYTIKTIVQRCKSGCKQIYEGDIIEQRDVNINTLGMKRLIDVFKGNSHFGCVKLKNNYRSEIGELADLL